MAGLVGPRPRDHLIVDGDVEVMEKPRAVIPLRPRASIPFFLIPRDALALAGLVLAPEEVVEWGGEDGCNLFRVKTRDQALLDVESLPGAVVSATDARACVGGFGLRV